MPNADNDGLANEGAEGLQRSFAAALRAAEAAPESRDAWDHLEDLAARLQRPDEIAALYARVLEATLTRELRREVAERAVGFYDEWFGDTPDRVAGLLSRIIELDREADWAVERLTMMLTSAGQWDALLRVYDRILATTEDAAKRKRLLEDAVQVAKDFADDGDRAARYLQQLLVLEPDNAQLATSLERLLERQERWGDLVELWRSRLDRVGAEEARETRLRIAVCWLERMAEPQRALEVLRDLLDESPGNPRACSELERILDLATAPLDTRRASLSLLRQAYLVAERPDDLIRALERTIAFVEPHERAALHREAATRLGIAGRDLEAIAHYRQLLLRDANDADARKQIRRIAQRCNRFDLHVEALVAAADACEDGALRVTVLLEAAEVRHQRIGDADGALSLYRQVVDSSESEPQVALAAAHSLSELYDAAGQEREQLAVLERLAQLEPSAAVKRVVLGRAARLAERLGEIERALQSWQPVLSADPGDLEALAATISLLERDQRHAELVRVLRQRAQAKVSRAQRRADLERIAEVEEKELGEIDDATKTWLQIRSEFGDDHATIMALDRLLSARGRWVELASMLADTVDEQGKTAASLVARLGAIHRELGDAAQVLSWYERALAVDPASVEAREGLASLLGGPHGDAAARALATAFRATGDWQGTLGVLDQRLASAEDRGQQARLLREAAELYEARGSDPSSAFACFAQALVAEPESLATEAELRRLAEAGDRWADTAAAFQSAAAHTQLSARVAELHNRAGAIFERQLADHTSALAAYRKAAEAEAQDKQAPVAIARCAARAGDWPPAADAALRAIRERDWIDPALIEWLEGAAAGSNQWRELTEAIEAAEAEIALGPDTAQQLDVIVTHWLRDRVGDLDAAERAAARAVSRRPSKREPLELLAGLQRRAPSAALCTTLLSIDALDDHGLDALFEAAKLSLELGGDAARTQNALEQLYRKAGGMWVRNEPATGEKLPSDIAQWALDKLIGYHLLTGNAERAVNVLIDGSRLPLDADKAVELRRRAAEMLAERGETGRAIDVYRGVLEGRPKDVTILQRVAELCENDGRISEALALRMRELSLVDDTERRLELRLDHSRLTGILEAQGGRVASLLANLSEAPGHESTLVELRTVLSERGRFEQLSEILAEQASKVEALGDNDRGAKLWVEVAKIAHTTLANRALAISAYTRVVELSGASARAAVAVNESLDALATLHLDRDEPAVAARWLERRLEKATATDRVAVLLRLARAQLRAEQHASAIDTLERAFDEAPRNTEVRKLLIGQYRSDKRWEDLARTLSRAALTVADEATALGYATEAADIYFERLAAPERAAPVLQRAVEIAKEDRRLKGMLAEAWRAAGELEPARELLAKIIEEFGRRRSPERAQSHFQLARVLSAQSRIGEAVDELDTASQMDPGNLSILTMLAGLARESGQLDRAERAYRTLLISVRRDAAPEKLPIGPSGVLFELSRIAAERGQASKAAELVESALEALASNDYEAERVQRAISERGEHELLARVLDARLTTVTMPHKRAAIYAAKADLLDGVLAKPEEGFAARLEAMKADPGSPLIQQAAWQSATSLGALDRYVSVLEALLADERADTNMHVRCELLLRLGEVLEKTRGDLERAASVYQRAAATNVRQVDVWRAQARIAGARHDEKEQLRLLELLASLGEDQAETRADALYRMAEVQLASGETLSDGLASLERALADDFRVERAGLILRRASEAHPADVRLLDVYERVARKSEDRKVLMHYLEKRARHTAAVPEQVREAVEVAEQSGSPDLAESLMVRAAELATGDKEKLAQVEWALLGLAERRMTAGDLAGAVKWLCEAAEVADVARLLTLGQRVAELASQPEGDLTLAAKLYEHLVLRAPTDPEAWGPLAQIYARLGDLARLERMVDETLDGLHDAEQRNRLRLEFARALLAHPTRAMDAVDVLQAVLFENPEHPEAQRLLIDHLERSGRSDELVELLARQLDVAEERRDAAAIKSAALRLGIEQSDPDRAVEIYRRALSSLPDDVELLETLLARLGPDSSLSERAELTERLARVEPAELAGRRALALCRIYDELGDSTGAIRALRIGAERCPDDADLRAELQERYRLTGDWAGLASTLLEAADRADGEARASLWREVAAIHRDQLGDPTTAADLLRRAVRLLPGRVDLRIELADALNMASHHEAAIATISEGLAGEGEPDLSLLVARARLLQHSGRIDEAITDLDHAFQIDAPSIAPELEVLVEARRLQALEIGDRPAERDYTLRSIDVLLVQGRRDEAAELLRGWTDRAGDDIEALRRLRDIDTAAGRWEAVATTCQRLVELESGADQIRDALAVTHAFRELGLPAHAKGTLEYTHQMQPDNAEVRASLRSIYEETGDRHRLASLLVKDAKGATDGGEQARMLGRAGGIFLELGDAVSAVPVLREAAALVPDDPDLVVSLIDAYLLAGWFDDANEQLDNIINGAKGKRTPEIAPFFHRKAQVAEAQGDRAKQLQWLQEAHNCAKKNGVFAAQLADLAEQLEQWDLATKTLRMITLLDTECPISKADAFYRQGRIALIQGDDKNARMWGRRARREDPASPEIENFLRELGEKV